MLSRNPSVLEHLVLCLHSLVHPGSSFYSFWFWSCHHTVKLPSCYLEFGICIYFPDAIQKFHPQTLACVSSISFSSPCPHLSEGSDPAQRYDQLLKSQSSWLPEDELPTPRTSLHCWTLRVLFCPWSFVEPSWSLKNETQAHPHHSIKIGYFSFFIISFISLIS